MDPKPISRKWTISGYDVFLSLATTQGKRGFLVNILSIIITMTVRLLLSMVLFLTKTL